MDCSLRRTSVLAATLLLALSACGGGGDEQSAPDGSHPAAGSDVETGVEYTVAGEDHPVVQELLAAEFQVGDPLCATDLLDAPTMDFIGEFIEPEIFQLTSERVFGFGSIECTVGAESVGAQSQVVSGYYLEWIGAGLHSPACGGDAAAPEALRELYGVEGDAGEAWVDAETGIGYLHAPDDLVQVGVICLENGNSLEIALQADPKSSAPGMIEKVRTKGYLSDHMETLLASAEGWDAHFTAYDEENSSH